MKTASRVVALALGTAGLFAIPARAHPGSGIVADRDGRVYVLDTGAGVWKLEANGGLTRVPGPAFHWMTIDQDNRFAKTRMPSGSGWEIARAGTNPTLLLASDFPLAVGLWLPRIRKISPDGKNEVVATVSR